MSNHGSLGGGGASVSMVVDDEVTRHFQYEIGLDASVLITPQDRKDQALQVLKADLMAKLDKEVKSLDDDSWMFDGPRSRINLISGPGGLRLLRHSETSAHGITERSKMI